MADDWQDLDSSGFADPTKALRLRDVMRRIAIKELGALTNNQQIGRVVSANFGSMTAQVWIPGDPGPITVNLLESVIPGSLGDETFFQNLNPDDQTGPGSLVVIEDVSGKLYITRVLSGGQFARNFGVAGLMHKSQNALHVPGDAAPALWRQTPPVSGSFGTSLSVFVPSSGVACMIGPFVGIADGVFWTGTMKVTVSRYEDTQTFEFNIAAETLERPTLASATRWYRVLPTTGGQRYTDFNLMLDVGLRTTSYRDNKYTNEIWLRLVDEDHGVDFCYVHIDALGPIMTYGDRETGRILIEDDNTPAACSGYLGVHDGYSLLRSRENEVGAVAAEEPNESNVAHMTGPWRNPELRLANDVGRMWSSDGAFTWNGTGVKWTNNIILTGAGPSRHGLAKGRLNIPMPANGTAIEIVPGDMTLFPYRAPAVVNSTDGIPLAAGQTLYFLLPPGMGNTISNGPTNWHNFNYMWVIVDNETYDYTTMSYRLPEWAIPIAHRGQAGEFMPFRVLAQDVLVNDLTMLQRTAWTAQSASLAAATVTKVWDAASFTFRNGFAYKVKFAAGAMQATTAGFIQFWLRKGTTAGGNAWIDFLRIAIATTGTQPVNFYREGFIANTTGADITTATNISAFSNVAAGVAYANNTQAKAWMEIAMDGFAADCPQAISIT